MIQLRKQTGFTIIELMLAMSFVAMLLVAIAIISMQLMSIYSKGLTIREVNQAGRMITDDMQRTIASSAPFSVVPKTGSASDPDDSKYVDKKGDGRLCVSGQTYAWNYGSSRELADPDNTGLEPAYNTYTDDGEAIRFVKVNDPGGLLCADTTEQIDRAQARELLTGTDNDTSEEVSAGDRNLAVQQLKITAGARDDVSNQALYAISLVLGTNDQAELNASNTACLPPSDGEGNEDFCAINQFNSIARAGNRSGSSS